MREVNPDFWVGDVDGPWCSLGVSEGARGEVSFPAGESVPEEDGSVDGRSTGLSVRIPIDSTAARSCAWVCWICFKALQTSLSPASPWGPSPVMVAMMADDAAWLDN